MYNASMVQASTYRGQSIFTLDITFPRAALAEFLTHRVFSKNTASTRAIPVKDHIKHIRENFYTPAWTKNQSGMQGGELTGEYVQNATDTLMVMFDQVVDAVEYLAGDQELGNCGVHKQDAGRYLEPFSYITLRFTTTQWKNFVWLRVDDAAYPPMQRIAGLIHEAILKADPMELKAGEYHVPSIRRVRDPVSGKLHYFSPENDELTLEEAIALSMSLCAQQSFRKADPSEKKTKTVLGKLFNGNKVHASPSEHQATPIDTTINRVGFVREDGKNLPYVDTSAWPEGVTHMDRQGALWSANYKGWIQHRQLLPNHDAELM